MITLIWEQKMSRKNTKFAKPLMLIDIFGTPDDVLNYAEFYRGRLEQAKKDLKSFPPEERENILKSQWLGTDAEKEWFDVHNPCYKVTSSVISKIKDIELPELLDTMLMPFNSFLIVLPKDEHSLIVADKGRHYIDGVMVSLQEDNDKTYICFIFYMRWAKGSYITSDVFNMEHPLSQQVQTKMGNEDFKEENTIFMELIKTALKISFIASNEILIEKENKILVSKKRNTKENVKVITDFICSDYRRFLLPNWQDIQSVLSGIGHELHYQFTRKGHWRHFRDSLGNVVNRVWVRQSLIRPDLPRKAELMR